MEQLRDAVLLGGAIALALMIAAALLRAIRGPRFTDRLMAGSMVSCMAVGEMCLLAVYLQEDFLLDVALIYALISFVALAVLARAVILRRREQMLREEVEKNRTAIGGREQK